MTALILVVDDVPANVKLLEAKLMSEYYNVISAKDGFEAIEQTKKHKPDLILLDVMMPGMDGFTTCRKLKEDPELSHIPVVMVTALSDPSDRVNGLEAGADDFLTKPINDAALMARVKSLIRIKVLMDELRLRDKTGLEMGIMQEGKNSFTSDVRGAHVVVIEDDVVQSKRIRERLEQSYRVSMIEFAMAALDEIKPLQDVDLIILSTQLTDVDGLRLATQLKNMDQLRNVPILMLVDEHETHLMLKGLDLGINDYLVVPIDYNEMTARVKTQIRRKRYQEALKSNYQQSISMAITDPLTGLYNRRYLDAHLANLVTQAIQNQKPLSMLIMDMDHFKQVNDTYGHDVGDEVLKQLAQMIVNSVRSSDLAARIGGEEFVVLLPETNKNAAYDLADRIRAHIASTPFKITHAEGQIHKTVSIGVSELNLKGDEAMDLVRRADKGLYQAKNSGRNRGAADAGGRAACRQGGYWVLVF
ncbi:MAG: PleD family two-component system response regulator [Rickettsiales bacterium]